VYRKQKLKGGRIPQKKRVILKRYFAAEVERFPIKAM